MANEDRIRQVVAAIEADQEHFDMQLFINQCGTTFCFAGWALKLSGADMNYWRDEYWKYNGVTLSGLPDVSLDDSAVRMEKYAGEWLGITQDQAHYLFNSRRIRTVEDLKRAITEELGISFDVVAS